MWSGANAGKGRGGKTYGKGKTSKGWTSSNWDVTHSWDSAGKGKGADWGSTGDWQQNWTEEKGQAKGKAGQTRDYIPRLEGRYAFSKAVLRPYCDEQGWLRFLMAVALLGGLWLYEFFRPHRVLQPVLFLTYAAALVTWGVAVTPRLHAACGKQAIGPKIATV
eukprot:s3804_g3.t1